MVHDWRSMFVDTDSERLGKHVNLKFIDENGEIHEFRLNSYNVNWLREALKRGKKLAKMADDVQYN